MQQGQMQGQPMQQGQMQGQLPSQPQGQQPMHGGGSPMQSGQPQFQVIQPSFNPGPGQYATYPQMAAFNSQGQLVLQPATQFLQPGQGGQQGQMILTSQLPPQKGQQHMISSAPGQPGKPMPGQPQQQQQYVITSQGQLQIPPGQTQMPPVNLMLAPPGMPSGMQVSMSGQPGQPPVMKTSDGKPVAGAQQQMPGQPQPQLIAMPGGQMAYMQAGPQHFLQNGQIIFRTPGTQEQPLMFSPSGTPPTGQPVAPGSHPTNLPPGSQQQLPMPASQGGQQRPGMPQPPPGKTAISRAIAPLISTSSQSQPRMGFKGNLPNQPSPKSKQKMSPRSGMANVGPGRPPGPKPQPGQMKGQAVPRMQSMTGPTNSPGPQGAPGTPGSPRPPLLQTSMANVVAPMGPHMMTMAGPPTLTPMMFPTQPTTVPVTTVTSMTNMPTNMPPVPNMPPMSMAQLPTQPLDQSTLVPTSAPMPPNVSMSEVGPPTLTKEAPMPNLGPPNLNAPTAPKVSTPAPEPTLTPAPKAVQAVKPQVLTHIIDGHVIKESSQPFPVSPTKKRNVLGKPMSRAIQNDIQNIQKMLDKDIEDSSISAPKKKDEHTPTAPVKRGPGRPPGSNNKNPSSKNNSTTGNNNTTNNNTNNSEPPEKRSKVDVQSGKQEAVTPLTSLQKPAPPPSPAPAAPAPLVAALPKVNIARWSVTEVCDFIKKLPGCSDYVEDFMVQEIDGQALMLLQADHLMSAMSIKLGPALKICEQVNQLKNDLAKN